MPRRWHQVGGAIRRRWWQESPITRESTKETVKTIRVRECRVIPVVLAVTNSRVFCFPREAAGAASTRHSPRPLLFRGLQVLAYSGRDRVAEGADVCVVLVV
jgi:hypothetical protein